MAILNFGSLNIDHVYQVDHFVRPGETLPSRSYQRFPGGKGFNQSIALARAGVPVHHAGKVGEDGVWLRDMLHAEGADASRVEVIDEPSGHAIIQVTPSGENAIVIHGGANQAITQADAQQVLAPFGAGDWLLLQNEISAMPEIMALARAQGMEIAFNPAPMQSQVLEYPLQHVSIFFVNETEGAELTGETSPARILTGMRNMFPHAATVLTLGEDGAVYMDRDREVHAPARKVTPVDTTAAGDTFIGYFLAAWTNGASPEAALDLATRAAAICVTRPGAAPSIPRREEVGGDGVTG